MRWRRLFQGFAVAAVAMLFASACLSEEGGGGGGGGGEAEAGDKQIEIMYGFGGDQSKGFEQGMAEFIQSSGINIKFTDASQSFDTLIRPRVQGNNPPDIALFPQPGLMLDFARQGKLQDLGGMLNLDSLRASLVPGILDTGTCRPSPMSRATFRSAPAKSPIPVAAAFCCSPSMERAVSFASCAMLRAWSAPPGALFCSGSRGTS